MQLAVAQLLQYGLFCLQIALDKQNPPWRPAESGSGGRHGKRPSAMSIFQHSCCSSASPDRCSAASGHKPCRHHLRTSAAA